MPNTIVRTLAVAALVMALAVAYAESAVTCADVANGLSGCINYAKKGGDIPAACCAGVKSLKSAADTADARQTTCKCIEAFVSKIDGIREDLAASIPGKCGVNIGFPISFSMDCSKVK